MMKTDYEFLVGDKVVVYYGEVMYEGTILKRRNTDEDGIQYFIHYKGFKTRWDDWVDADDVLVIDDTNRDHMERVNKRFYDSLKLNSSRTPNKNKKKGTDQPLRKRGRPKKVVKGNAAIKSTEHDAELYNYGQNAEHESDQSTAQAAEHSANLSAENDSNTTVLKKRGRPKKVVKYDNQPKNEEVTKHDAVVQYTEHDAELDDSNHASEYKTDQGAAQAADHDIVQAAEHIVVQAAEYSANLSAENDSDATILKKRSHPKNIVKYDNQPKIDEVTKHDAVGQSTELDDSNYASEYKTDQGAAQAAEHSSNLSAENYDDYATVLTTKFNVEHVDTEQTTDTVQIAEHADTVRIAEDFDDVQIIENADTIQIAEDSDDVQIIENDDDVQIIENDDDVQIIENADTVQIDEDSDDVQIVEHVTSTAQAIPKTVLRIIPYSVRFSNRLNSIKVPVHLKKILVHDCIMNTKYNKILKFADEHYIAKVLYSYSKTCNYADNQLKCSSLNFCIAMLQCFNSVVHQKLLFPNEKLYRLQNKGMAYFRERHDKQPTISYVYKNCIFPKKVWCFVYGPRYLLRLIVNLPKIMFTSWAPQCDIEFFAQNVDALLEFLEANYETYFSENDYIEQCNV